MPRAGSSRKFGMRLADQNEDESHKSGPIFEGLGKNTPELEGDGGAVGGVKVQAGTLAKELGSETDGETRPKKLPMLRDQDRLMPMANISRLMCSTTGVSPNIKIAQDAKTLMQECVSEFISFVTSEMAEIAQKEKRKTVGPNDLLRALNNLGFENYVEPLKLYLIKYREEKPQPGISIPTAPTATFPGHWLLGLCSDSAADDEAKAIEVDDTEGVGVAIIDGGQYQENVQEQAQDPELNF